MTPHPTSGDLAAALAAHTRQDMPSFPGRTNPHRAAVLVPLYWAPDPVCVVTQRATTLREHGGEVSFPGGKPEAGESLEQTAVREAGEEIGARVVSALGGLSSIPVFTSPYRLVPFVAEIAVDGLRANPAEVAHIERIRLLDMLRWPSFDALGFELRGERVLSPVFPTSRRRMFGATAHVFHELLQVVASVYGMPLPPMVTGGVSWEELQRPVA